MRLSVGDSLRIFNNSEGEYVANIDSLDKKQGTLSFVQCLRKADISKTEPSLAFGLVKQDALNFIIEKATELGIGSFFPLKTAHAQVSRINQERVEKNIIEAVEQSERLTLPTLESLKTLSQFLNASPGIILWAWERSEKTKNKSVKTLQDGIKLAKTGAQKCSFLVGPEGGFSREEIELLLASSNVIPVNLGDSILRSETACLMMISCYRSF